MEKRELFKVCYIYDTETCNIIDRAKNSYKAYPVLYIFNDISAGVLANYEEDKSDYISFLRTEKEAIEYIKEAVDFGKDNDIIPVVCVYNAMFDLLPLLNSLSKLYKIDVNAKSGNSIYTLDLIDEGNKVLRFWDVSFLEPRGLSYMGETCGLVKACGDWDYEKIRTTKTELTEDELFYAKRDVQVIPAYLRYLLENNEFINEEDFGSKLITKTSLIRLFSKRVTGQLKYKNGKTVLQQMIAECEREEAKTFESYMLRKACFRGGLSFSAANNASQIIENIWSLDAVSMHHTFINGRYVPCKFKKLDFFDCLKKDMEIIKNKSIKEVLEFYHVPFDIAFNAKIKIENVRLKKGSIFEREGIAILSESKFFKNAIDDIDESKREATLNLFNNGYNDRACGYVNYFGKIYEADEMVIHLNEVEWYCFNLVYEFDNFEILEAESTSQFVLPPDFVTLLSRYFYRQKNEVKKEMKKAEGTDKYKELNEYYNIIVKGSFNGIYGAQAQDINKPGYKFENNTIKVDKETIKTRENFETKGSKCVNYNYGSRIAAGSRLHLLIAIELIARKFGGKVKILGGDTDSIKLGCDKDIKKEDITKALESLHKAAKSSLEICGRRIKKNFNEFYDDMDCVGCFEIENEEAYVCGVEYWNKCRMMKDSNNKFHITIAGVSRPDGEFNLEDLANRLCELGYSDDFIFSNVIGYNITYMGSISHFLDRSIPRIGERVKMKIKDYKGDIKEIDEPASTCLFNSARVIGSELVETNYKSLVYLMLKGVNVDKTEKIIFQNENSVFIDYPYTLERIEIPKEVKNGRDN